MDAVERDDLDAGVLSMTRTREAGFTLVEVMIAVVILSIVVLSVPRVGLDFTRTVSSSRVRNEANAVANAWISRCRAEPNYGALDSAVAGKCRGTVTNLGTFAFTRTTTVAKDSLLSGVADSLNDYKRITVVVSGGGMVTPVTRTVTIARF